MPLNVAAGGRIPLLADGATDGFGTENGAILIEDAGTYYVSYTVTVPADVRLATEITPFLNGIALPAGAVSIDKDCDEHALTVSGQVTFTAAEEALFTLMSSAALSLAGVTPLVRLNIMLVND